MPFSRRHLLKTSLRAGAVLSAAPLVEAPFRQQREEAVAEPAAFGQLKPLGKRVQPIAVDEFRARIAHAQRLMTEANPSLAALYLTAGSSLYYYSGIRWGLSERLMALTIPRNGEPLLVCPAFEEGRLRELQRWPMEIRAWQEDENPSLAVAKWLEERGLRTGRIGVEETVRYTFFDALRRAAPGCEYVSGDPVTIGCRARKSAHELELMRLACEATCDVFRAVFASLHEGMTERDIAGLISRGFRKMGLGGGALVLLGEWAARPHGTTEPQTLQEGAIVLADGGTLLEGYASDVTRCTVLGKPSDKLRRAFDVVHKAQEAALSAAARGRLSGTVDAAARNVITAAGYGSDYKLFTHRLGHGIGLDGHEHPYLVRGSRTVLEPGMTFSNEPGIYVRGEYGLRLEDDMVIRDDGPAQLLTPGLSLSLEKPLG